MNDLRSYVSVASIPDYVGENFIKIPIKLPMIEKDHFFITKVVYQAGI